ncbi:phosphatidate cytidylyltransferase [Paracoccus aminophilus]|uniref:Phosphatidate cytidylyltransferase n=1 Tax=Paracoccus aminophilus JCM 7686 TaxID=1367847 RepID=S5XNS5_PARAH|nr:phosphatidate cytidylyltransferase [Paracoccus aminophilus]AGT08979.1 phosphatidate cytidylyltransferase [Paracoccus aminophilus JCM 7686]
MSDEPPKRHPPLGPQPGEPGRRGASANWSDLGARIASGAVLIALGALLIFSTGIWLCIGVSLLCGGMIWELARLTGWRHPEFHSPRHPLLIGILGGLTLLAMLTMPGDWPMLLAVIPIIFGWSGTHRHERPAYLVFTLGILLSGYSLVVLREVMGLETTLWIVGTVVLSDVLGYFVGRRLGGPKFWPAISPKKTWSGTVAGWIGAIVLAVVLVVLGQTGWAAVLVAPLLAFCGQMGDIAESWLKRRVGVKDSSDLIPGHGGLMDRFDAMCGAFIVALLMLMLGLLPQIGG